MAGEGELLSSHQRPTEMYLRGALRRRRGHAESRWALWQARDVRA